MPGRMQLGANFPLGEVARKSHSSSHFELKAAIVGEEEHATLRRPHTVCRLLDNDGDGLLDGRGRDQRLQDPEQLDSANLHPGRQRSRIGEQDRSGLETNGRQGE